MCVFMCVISSHQRVLWTTVFTDFALEFVTGNVKTENFTETVKLFALGLQCLVICTKGSINKFVLPGQVNILYFLFFEDPS